MQAVYLSTSGDSTTFLSTPLEVQGYGCGIIELDGKVVIPKRLLKKPTTTTTNPGNPGTPDDEDGFSENLYLCSDIVEESDVGNIKMPVLRYLKRKNGIPAGIDNVIWLKVMRPSISRIRLYIADETGQILSVPKNTLNCTLLFIPAK